MSSASIRINILREIQEGRMKMYCCRPWRVCSINSTQKAPCFTQDAKSTLWEHLPTGIKQWQLRILQPWPSGRLNAPWGLLSCVILGQRAGMNYYFPILTLPCFRESHLSASPQGATDKIIMMIFQYNDDDDDSNDSSLTRWRLLRFPGAPGLGSRIFYEWWHPMIWNMLCYKYCYGFHFVGRREKIRGHK